MRHRSLARAMLFRLLERRGEGRLYASLETSTRKVSSLMGEMTDKAKGKVKQTVGRATDDEQLEGEGIVDSVKGHVKGAVNEIKSAVKNVAHKKP